MSQPLLTSALMIRSETRRYRPATSEQILAAARQVIEQRLPHGAPFNSPDSVKDYLCIKLAGLEHEVFVALWLNTRYQLIAYAELFRGTINATAVYSREVVKDALKHNAAAVVFVHNHPSGHPEPSVADRAITQHLKEALELIEVRVLDHLVVGGTAMESMAHRGWL